MTNHTPQDDSPGFDVEDILFALADWPRVEATLLDWQRRNQTPAGTLTRELDEALLTRAMFHPDEQFRAIAARAGTWSCDVMDMAIDDHSASVRAIAANSTATPPEGLAAASLDSAVTVRLGVAGNRSTPLPALLAMLDDDDRRVQVAAVAQYRFPCRVMSGLADSDDPDMLSVLAAGPRVTPTVLHKVATRSRSLTVWLRLAQNHTTQSRSLDLIPLGQHPHLHQLLLKHPNASDALCRRVAVEYLDRPDAPLRLVGLSLMFRGPVKVAPWGQGRFDAKVPRFKRPSDVVAWLADGADLSTVMPYAMNQRHPEWLRWFIVCRAELDEATRARLASDREPRLRQLACERSKG